MNQAEMVALRQQGYTPRIGNGYRCPHGVIQAYGNDCPQCRAINDANDPVRREDEMRQTLIDLTAAFNRVAEAVEMLAGTRAGA